MYFIVDKMIFLFSESLRDWWPYKWRWGWLITFKLFFWAISLTVVISGVRWVMKRGHENRKWSIFSMPWVQIQMLLMVSIKLWRHLWFRKGLSLSLNWKIYRRPMGSYILNVLLIFGRKRDSRCSLSLLIDGIVSKCLIIMFQEATPLGKKLFMNLDDRHLISRRVLATNISTK